jgi:hypothetical protein
MIGQNNVNLSCCVTTHSCQTTDDVAATEKWWLPNSGLKITYVAANWTLFMAVLYVKF